MGRRERGGKMILLQHLLIIWDTGREGRKAGKMLAHADSLLLSSSFSLMKIGAKSWSSMGGEGGGGGEEHC